MAEDKTVVLDISSDEDVGWGDRVVACGGGGYRDDGDWISELLDEVDKETDDSDEVVVVGEVIVKPNLRVSRTLVKCVNDVRNGDDDDDECVVLDGDPDKPVSIQNDKGGGDDSDDLLVVSEKGQVACRDYPHARHLCVKFPFNSTPHEKHCDQCHCYVCDSLAPCAHWSTSISSIDHCHAIDKDEFWKAQRKGAKKIDTIDKTPPVVSGVPDTSFSVGRSPSCQTSSYPFDPLLHNAVITNECQVRSLATSNGTPNTVTYGRTQPPGCYARDNRFQQHFLSNQLRNTHNNVMCGDRRHIVGNAASQVISRATFKRTGAVAGVFPNNRYCNNTSRSNYGYQFSRSQPPAARWLDPRDGATPALNTFRGSSKSNVSGIATNSMPNISAQTNMSSGNANYTPCQPQIFPQAHGSSLNRHTVGSEHQVSSQIFVGSNLTDSMPTQPAVATEPNWNPAFDSPYPFQPQASSCPGAKFSQNPIPSQPLVTSPSNITQPNTGICFEIPLAQQSQFCSQPAPISNVVAQQSQFCSQPAPLSNVGKNTFVQGNPTENATEFEFCSDSHRSNSNQPLPVEYNQLQNVMQRDEPAVPLDSDSQFPGSNNPSPLDFRFDSWIFEEALEIPEINVETKMRVAEGTVAQGVGVELISVSFNTQDRDPSVVLECWKYSDNSEMA